VLPPSVLGALASSPGGGSGGAARGMAHLVAAAASARGLWETLRAATRSAATAISSADRCANVAAVAMAFGAVAMKLSTPAVVGVAASAASRSPAALGRAAGTPSAGHPARGAAAAGAASTAATAALAAWAATADAAVAAAAAGDVCAAAAAWQAILRDHSVNPKAAVPPAVRAVAENLGFPAAMESGAGGAGLQAAASDAVDCVRPCVDTLVAQGADDSASVRFALAWTVGVLSRMDGFGDARTAGWHMVAHGCGGVRALRAGVEGEMGGVSDRRHRANRCSRRPVAAVDLTRPSLLLAVSPAPTLPTSAPPPPPPPPLHPPPPLALTTRCVGWGAAPEPPPAAAAAPRRRRPAMRRPETTRRPLGATRSAAATAGRP